MSNIITHRRIRIVTLERGELIADHCSAGDIAIVQQDDAWWTYFIGDDGEVDGYDLPFESYNKALWTAKAAAEFSAE